MDRYTDSSGSMFTLGKEIGRGGEGAVYTIPNNPGLVAKIFFNGIDKEKGEKLFALSQLKTRELLEFCAWPVDVLKNSQSKTVGLVMPIVEGHSEIHEFYSPAARKKNLPKADRAFLIHVAINLADAVSTIHKHGHVIGDINQKGILVHPGAGTVKMVDCDSFQVEYNQKRFICKVGVPDFTPPEVRRVGFEKPREANQDNFGLAVLIFQLLFMGRHPFAGRFLGQGDDSLEKAIESYRFAYGRTSKQKQMLPPPGMDKLAVLDTSILSLFERAFDNLGANVLRPSANEWKRELTRLKSDLIHCGKSNIHKYPRAHGSCIWCELEKGAGFFFFLDVASFSLGGSQQLNIVAIKARFLAIRIIDPPIPVDVNATIANNPKIDADPIPNRFSKAKNTIRAIKLTAVFFAIVILASGPISLVNIILISLIITAGFGWEIKDGGLLERFKTQLNLFESEVSGLQSAITGSSLFKQAKDLHQVLRQHIQDSENLPAWKKQKLDELGRNIEAKQREYFLEQHDLDSATITRVGPAIKSVLASYGIETAADIGKIRSQSITGVGPATIGKLEAWKSGIERRFVFDRTKGIPASEIFKLEKDYQGKSDYLKEKLEVGISKLAVLSKQCDLAIQHYQQNIPKALEKMAKAQTNYNRVRKYTKGIF